MNNSWPSAACRTNPAINAPWRRIATNGTTDCTSEINSASISAKDPASAAIARVPQIPSRIGYVIIERLSNQGVIHARSQLVH